MESEDLPQPDGNNAIVEEIVNDVANEDANQVMDADRESGQETGDETETAEETADETAEETAGETAGETDGESRALATSGNQSDASNASRQRRQAKNRFRPFRTDYFSMDEDPHAAPGNVDFQPLAKRLRELTMEDAASAPGSPAYPQSPQLPDVLETGSALDSKREKICLRSRMLRGLVAEEEYRQFLDMHIKQLEVDLRKYGLPEDAQKLLEYEIKLKKKISMQLVRAADKEIVLRMNLNEKSRRSYLKLSIDVDQKLKSLELKCHPDYWNEHHKEIKKQLLTQCAKQRRDAEISTSLCYQMLEKLRKYENHFALSETNEVIDHHRRVLNVLLHRKPNDPIQKYQEFIPQVCHVSQMEFQFAENPVVNPKEKYWSLIIEESQPEPILLTSIIEGLWKSDNGIRGTIDGDDYFFICSKPMVFMFASPSDPQERTIRVISLPDLELEKFFEYELTDEGRKINRSMFYVFSPTCKADRYTAQFEQALANEEVKPYIWLGEEDDDERVKSFLSELVFDRNKVTVNIPRTQRLPRPVFEETTGPVYLPLSMAPPGVVRRGPVGPFGPNPAFEGPSTSSYVAPSPPYTSPFMSPYTPR